MNRPGHTANGERRSSGARRIASAMLLAYLGLLLQPCALAMSHDPDAHAGQCHDAASQPADSLCLSQPASDCATDDSVFDAKESRKLVPDAYAVIVLATDHAFDTAPAAIATRYASRAPPFAATPLHVRHCVFLK